MIPAPSVFVRAPVVDTAGALLFTGGGLETCTRHLVSLRLLPRLTDLIQQPLERIIRHLSPYLS